MNLARSMMIEKEVPREFWLEAVNWVVHLMNQSPTIAVRDRTPKEAWSNLKPSVKHFKVFDVLDMYTIMIKKEKKWMTKALNVYTWKYVMGQRPI